MARRQRYSAEFKRQALKRADEPGVTDALVCEELGISTRQLRRWRAPIASTVPDTRAAPSKATDYSRKRLSQASLMPASKSQTPPTTTSTTRCPKQSP